MPSNRTLEYISLRQRLARRKPFVITALAAVMVVGASSAVAKYSRHEGNDEMTPLSMPSDVFQGPFPGDYQVSLAQAVQSASYRVFVPNSPQANSSNLQQVWIDNAGDIGFVYTTNITVMMWPSAYPDPSAGLQTVLQTTTAKASLIQVGNSPGIELYPDTAANANPAWVEFVRAGVDVNISSSTQSVDDLVSVANSMTSTG
jgi:hypothetical protein